MADIIYSCLLVNPLNTAQPLIIPLIFQAVMGYFDFKLTSKEEYEDEYIAIMNLQEEELVWDLSGILPRIC